MIDYQEYTDWDEYFHINVNQMNVSEAKILIFDTNIRILDVWYGFCFWIFFLDAITHSCVSLSGNSSELMIKIDGSNERIQGNWYK